MADLAKAVESFASQLAEKVEHFIGDMTTLEVRTYTTPEDQIKVLLKQPPDANQIATEGAIRLRAYTQVSFDGDATVFVPEKDGEIDRAVWDLHQTMVNQAMQNRATMIKTMGDAAAAALNALKRARE